MATNNTLNNTAENLTVSSGFTVTAGGPVNILNGSAGITLGSPAVFSKTITIGNSTVATVVALQIGTGNFNVTSNVATLLNVYSGGYCKFPVNAAFYGYLGTADANVTGNGATYTLGTTGNALSELFDRSNSLSSLGIFTTPVAGIFFFTTTLYLTGITAAETTCNLSINSTQSILQTNFNVFNMSVGGVAKITAVHMCNMTAANSTRVQLTISGGVSNGVSVGVGSFFSGFRIA